MYIGNSTSLYWDGPQIVFRQKFYSFIQFGYHEVKFLQEYTRHAMLTQEVMASVGEVLVMYVWNILLPAWEELTHWGRVTHICVNKLTIIGSDNGLLPGQRQAIIWTNAGILLIGPLGTNFSEISIEI